MSYSEYEAKSLLFNSIKAVADHPDLGQDWLDLNLPALVKGYRSADYIYQPDNTLIERIDDYLHWCETEEGENPGNLMEEIAYLAFRCLRGWESIKSYQSFAPQLDLVISGSDTDWRSFIMFLRPDWDRTTLVIEAKNISEKVDDKVFSRLCGILSNVFEHSSNLGVFFTRLGATGFPEDEMENDGSRKRKLSDAQATQIIFHAKTGKCVIVFTHSDIINLKKPGALPRLLEAKIRSIEEFTGLPIEFNESWQEIDLPAHLQRYNKE